MLTVTRLYFTSKDEIRTYKSISSGIWKGCSVYTRVSKLKGPKLLGTSRNEFGGCGGPGNMRNGAVWVYLPSS